MFTALWKIMRPTFCSIVVVWLLLAELSLAHAADRFVDWVAPVLSSRCLGCHNDTKSEGGLSITDPSQLIEQGHVDPSDAATSHLMELVSPSDGLAKMPKDSDPLNPDQIAAIGKWIDGGAIIPKGFHLHPREISDRDWWSLQPIKVPTEPVSANRVDQLVNQKLSEKGLKPLPRADPVTLIRRLTYDLSGLPPTPRQIDAFVIASRVDPELAWNDLVDRLLDAPEFGEKWGQHWLDIARYAESHGYDKDQPRKNAWPYRDYVIKSFNTDKPFGKFATEQIAGDVLADDRAEGIVATGFLAAGPWDLIAHQEVGEGKLDGRIAKHLDRDEMSAAVFNVFQSTTIQCAQCHHHKFDPIASEDYYRVQAVFAGIDRADRVYAGLSTSQLSAKRELQDERTELARRRDKAKKELDQKIAKKTSTLDPRIRALSGKANRFPPPSQHGFHSKIASRADKTKWVQVDLGKPQQLDRIELIACYDEFNGIGSGFGFPVRFKVEVTADETLTDENARTLIDATAVDYANPGSLPVQIDTGNDPVRIIRVTATKLAERRSDFILALGELRAVAFDSQQNADGPKNPEHDGTVTASDHLPPNSRWAPKFLIDGKFHRHSLEDSEREELTRLRQERQAIVDAAVPPGYQAQTLKWNRQIASIDQQIKAFPKGKLVYAASTDFPIAGKFRPTEGLLRPIHFLHRGDLKSPGERMLPGAPKLWSDAPTRFAKDHSYDEAEARADLARYVSRKDNPLLWRSAVNRIWQWTFGKPIVGTPNDFGRMGSMPTHPLILDLLAAALRDDPNQSIKSIVGLLVNTDAYRRASFRSGTPELAKQNSMIDDSNDFLWRFNRRRLTAEEFRDSVLSVSGALRQNGRGGPSFKDFVVEHPQHSPHYQYDLHDPNDTASHRRTIYRFVVRSQPHPMLTTLDCADPSISIARRDESTTALQALAQWNNQLVEAMSKQFAKRLRLETANDEDAISLACRLAWGRGPNRSERGQLIKLVEEYDQETFCRVVLNASPMMYLD